MYLGYADDPRNTDNAWLEARVLNYHDEDGTLLKNFVLRVSTAQMLVLPVSTAQMLVLPVSTL